jgi:hypothetical protein
LEQKDLKKTKTVKYSKRERQVFDLIAESGDEGVTTKEIGEKLFKDDVFFVKESVISALTSLRRKVEHNQEPFTIKAEGIKGPRPMRVFIVPREYENELNNPTDTDDENEERVAGFS